MNGDRGPRSRSGITRDGRESRSLRSKARGVGGSRAAATAVAIVAGLMAAVLGAGPVVAADELAVTTPYPAVSVAPGSKASFDLTVTTTQRTRVDLGISGVPTGWTAQLNGGGYVVT